MTVNYRELLYHWPANVLQNRHVVAKTTPLEPSTTEKATTKKRHRDHVELTERDRRLFDVLKRVRCLGQKQIEELLKNYGGTCRKRLLRLSRAGYLKKLTYGQRGGVYGVAWTGGQRLQQEMKSFSARNLFELEHQLGLNQVYLNMILSSRSYEEHIDWQDGCSSWIQFVNTKIIPDAVLKILPLKRVIYLEFDRGTKNLKRLEKQLRHYRSYFESPYAKDNEEVWFFATTQARCESIAKFLYNV